MRSCPPCRGLTPAVWPALVVELLGVLNTSTQADALVRSMKWLLERHRGLTMYQAITGRDYTYEERREIALDLGEVAETDCPYLTSDVEHPCCLGDIGLGPHSSTEEAQGKAPYGWLPTLIVRALDRGMLVDLAKAGQIADAKLATLTRQTIFPYRGMPTADDLVNKKQGYMGLPPGTDLTAMDMASGKIP